jgi:hypothetical protein
MGYLAEGLGLAHRQPVKKVLLIGCPPQLPYGVSGDFLDVAAVDTTLGDL